MLSSSAFRLPSVSLRASSRVVPSDGQAAAHWDRYAKTVPGMKKTIRFVLWAMAVLFLSTVNGFPHFVAGNTGWQSSPRARPLPMARLLL